MTKKLPGTLHYQQPLELSGETGNRNCQTLSLPRCLTIHQESIKEVKLHAFGDASGYGVSAVIYAVVTQESGV